MADDRALPLILAGPIVRRVEPRACTVWIALSAASGAVKLTVWKGIQMSFGGGGSVTSGDPPVGSATVATRQFGRKLHIALVTLTLPVDQPPLQPGTIYAYDLQVDDQGLRPRGLLQDHFADPAHPDPPSPRLALGYATDRLPSFVTPPPKVEQTCFAHTSCRRSNAPDFDALPAVDHLIELSLTAPLDRPQQLFLTGDQIYADDLSADVLTMLSSIAHAVVGPDEVVGGVNVGIVTYPPDDITGSSIDDPTAPVDPADRVLVKRGRLRAVQQLAGFSTSDDHHLLSFGEYAAMYIAAWNPEIWDLPDTDATPDSIRKFRAGVPAVARALANTATYMIFDDHDVTDDWNLSQKWVNRVYTKPMGTQIIRNALCAYALFQGWGNDPVAFTTGRNLEFLNQIATRFGQATGPYPKGDDSPMNQLLGLITATPEQMVKWHYQVPSPGSLMIVLDTRTRRKFNGQGYQPPDLLGTSRDTQLPAGPLTDGREMLFVISAAPVIAPDVIDSIGWPAAQIAIDAVHAGRGLDGEGFDRGEIGELYVELPRPNVGTEKYDAEGWSANEPAREEFLKRLATYPASAILSGDVHFSCTVVMDHYRQGVAKPSRIVQLTCSPARNQFKAVVKLLTRQNPVLQQVAGALAISRLAWTGPSSVVVPSPAIVSPGRRGRLVRSPSLIPAGGWPAGTAFPPDKPPDWRWRLTVQRDARHEAELPASLRQPLFTAGQELTPGANLDGYRRIAARHQSAAQTHYEHLRQLVFKSNIGVVRILRDADGKLRLRHSLFSAVAPASPLFQEGTRHEMSLAPSTEPAPELATR
ncbi:MAG: hypothetical protein ABI702_04330 [Burkholderiales bacterium]